MRNDKRNFTRVNRQIRAYKVRVTKDGEQLGVLPVEQALKMAQLQGLDLVEIVPHATPPVCTILDYGKFKYDQKIKEKERRKKVREQQIQVKELRLSPVIADQDLDVKVNAARKFLQEGKKVQFNLKIKGRQMMHKDEAFHKINRAIKALDDISKIDLPLKISGNKIFCRLQPN